MALPLTLQLERPEPTPTFRPGQRIRGTVRVLAPQACRCDSLMVSLLWHTHGKGNEQKKVVQEVKLFEGEWAAASEGSYPFELEVPAGPYSYAGTVLHIDWAVRARADVPWAVDPQVQTRILVRPWDAASLPAHAGSHYRDAALVPNDDFETGDAIASPAEAARSQANANGCLVGCGGLLTCAGLLGIAVVALDGPNDTARLLFALPVGLVMLSIGLVRRWSARRLGGAPVVTLEPEIVEVGRPLEVLVAFTVPVPTELEAATATFRGKEIAVSGSGKNKSTYEELLHEAVVELAPAGTTLDPSTPCELRASFRVPVTEAHSFEVDSNKVHWSVEVVVNPKGAPAWSRIVPVTVRPPRIERLRDEPDETESHARRAASV